MDATLAFNSAKPTYQQLLSFATRVATATRATEMVKRASDDQPSGRE
jgi:hypothetical protein